MSNNGSYPALERFLAEKERRLNSEPKPVTFYGLYQEAKSRQGKNAIPPDLGVIMANFKRTPEGKKAAAEAAEWLLDELLKPLYSLLEGTDPLFVPCGLASKRPSVKYAELTHDNIDDFYLEELVRVASEGGNLAVKLGPISGDLCAFDIDRDDLVEPFLEVNPALRETLRTRGKKGCQFWFRCVGPYPERVAPLVDGDGKAVGEWRGGGNGLSTIFGVHESSADLVKTNAPPNFWRRYEIVVKEPIVTIKYSDLVIPLDWVRKRKKPGENFRWSSNSKDEE